MNSKTLEQGSKPSSPIKQKNVALIYLIQKYCKFRQLFGRLFHCVRFTRKHAYCLMTSAISAPAEVRALFGTPIGSLLEIYVA